MKIFPVTVLSTLCVLHLLGQETSSFQDCGTSSRPQRVTVRHIEGKGIGYTQGYSTAELFITPTSPWNLSWVPFIDLRGHAFNNGRAALNGGIGFRYIGERVVGVNVYYDYRKTAHLHYNQIGVGVESLGTFWDFRANGYIPIGKTKTYPFHAKFHRFKGHHLLMRCQQELSMGGVNVEVGFHVDQLPHVPFYFGIGPYYFGGHGKSAFGGEMRARVTLWDYVRLEGSSSCDTLFKWIAQGQLSLIVPFGAKKPVKQKSRPCSTELSLKREGASAS